MARAYKNANGEFQVEIPIRTGTDPASGVLHGLDHLSLPELAADVAAPGSTRGRLYVKDSSGRTKLYMRDSTGVVRLLDENDIGSDVQAWGEDLDAVAALTTSSFGRGLLELADAAAGRTELGLGTAATHATGDYDAAGAAASALTTAETYADAIAAGIDARYRQIVRTIQRGISTNISGSGIYVAQIAGGLAVASAANLVPLAIYLDDADLAVAGRTTKLRIVASCGVNDTAVGTSLTVGLYPVGTPSGPATAWNPNFGTVLSGSTVTFTTPGANTKSGQSSSGDFDVPSAGWYCFGVSASGAMTANSVAMLPMRLEVRNV